MSSQEELSKQIFEQGEIVRSLKEQGKDFKAELEKLRNLKTLMQKFIDNGEAQKQFRADVEGLLNRRQFYIPAFEIYGGVAGLYDYGPSGCVVKECLIENWREHFVLSENMLEIAGTNLTPEIVLKTSGHVDRFTDFMVRDEKTGDCYRADKLVEEVCEELLKAAPVADKKKRLELIRNTAGAMNAAQLKEVFAELSIVSPDTKNPLSDPFPFNLMFGTQIGPTGKLQGYLRPETAQGIFVNFRRLLEYNAGKMPFAAAQIGMAFRNEIAPRSGLLRVREFQMAEIEHFVNPDDKRHSKFKDVADVVLTLFDRDSQEKGGACLTMTASEAVSKKVIANETLAYYMARTQLFLLRSGVIREKLRFRQHLSNEMAHYAQDCWDAEIQTSYGWIECVGHADRACYDLEMHSKRSKVDLIAQETLAEPKTIQKPLINLDNGLLGRTFKGKAQVLIDHLKSLTEAQALELDSALKSLGEGQKHTIKLCTGDSFEVDSKMIKDIRIVSEKVSVLRYIPSVIEPSFGLGRILYSIFEHAYRVRPKTSSDEKESKSKDTEKRAYLSVAPHLAPIKVAILPISHDEKFEPFLKDLAARMLSYKLSSKIDDSSTSIGRRYARFDELGTPFGVTLDFESLKEAAENKEITVTLRERDSMGQVRLPLQEVASVVCDLVHGRKTWQNVAAKYPIFIANETD